MRGAGKSQTGPSLRRVVSPLFSSGTNSDKSSQLPCAFASAPVRCCAASPSRFSRDLAQSCKQCASRVYFQLKRRRRRENSLQGGEQHSRWLRGESTFFWRALSVSSHSLGRNTQQVLLSDRCKRKNVGLLSFVKTQRLHSVGSSHLRPGSHTNQRLGDEAVPIYTRA